MILSYCHHLHTVVNMSQSPSTVDKGFILSPTLLENPATSDRVFQRILECEYPIYRCTRTLLTISGHLPQDQLPKIVPNLTRFGSDAISKEINSHIGNAEMQEPYIKTRNVWGARYDVDRLVTSTGWKELGKWGIKQGRVLPILFNPSQT